MDVPEGVQGISIGSRMVPNLVLPLGVEGAAASCHGV